MTSSPLTTSWSPVTTVASLQSSVSVPSDADPTWAPGGGGVGARLAAHRAADPYDDDPNSPGGMSSVRTALDCGVLPVLSLLGIVGNSLCALVFVRQRYRTVAKPLLLAFLVSDILFLLATLLVSLPCLVSKVGDEEEGRTLHLYMLPQVDVFRDVSSRVTVMLTLAIGVERCVAVTRPLKLRGVCSIPRTRSAVLLVFLLVLALKAPAFFRYDVTRRPSSADNENVTAVQLHRTRFYVENTNALEFYLDYFLLVILQGLPLLSVAVCFVIVLVSLKRKLQCAYPKTVAQFGAFARARGGKGRDRYTEKEHADLVLEERKLTRALLAVLLLCVLSELPYLVTEAMHVMRPEDQSSSFLVARDVSRLICVLNAALHFPVFMALYKPFSVTCKTLVGMCN
ncbi:FMRFamide receptor-like [Babylonia areolata]|uniref:FMRFamide receptor-like n=1 Tax=Babylonia areolata TaxID=304850 RepID=UPI003FCEEA11